MEALTGEVPFRGRTATERLEKIEAGLGPTPIPLGLRRIVRRGLAFRPAERFADMRSLVTALVGAQKRPRRLVQLGLSATLVGVAVFGATVGDDARCTDRPLDAEWEARRGPLREAFVGAEATKLWSTTESSLDAYVTAWSDSAADACRATRVTGEHSEQVLDLRMACLDPRRAELRATWELLAQPDAKTLENTPKLLAALPDVDWCRRTGALLEATPLPTDADHREAVTQARDELARARPLRFIHPEKAAAVLDELDANMESLDYPPLEAEVALARARLQQDEGARDDASASYKRALWLAEGIRLDEVSAAAAEGLSKTEGTVGGEDERGREWAELARAIHRRHGRPDGL